MTHVLMLVSVDGKTHELPLMPLDAMAGPSPTAERFCVPDYHQASLVLPVSVLNALADVDPSRARYERPIVQFFIHDRPLEGYFYDRRDGSLAFELSETNRLSHFFGCIQIEVHVSLASLPKATLRFITAPFDLMLSPGAKLNALKAMSEYVWTGLPRWLPAKRSHRPKSSLVGAPSATLFDARLKLYQRIVDAYESLYPAFGQNAYRQTQKDQIVTDVEQSAQLTADSLRYLATHPDTLVEAPYGQGIGIGNRYYQPTTILSERARTTLDAYENQVVVGFLNSLEMRLSDEVRLMDEHLKALPNASQLPEGFMLSSQALTSVWVEALHGYKERLLTLQSELTPLRHLYRTLWQIPGVTIGAPVALTPRFQAQPHYYQVYALLTEWLQLAPLDLRLQSVFLDVFERNVFFEYYVLFKTLQALEASGYHVETHFHYDYMGRDPRARECAISNTFILRPQRDDGPIEQLTLYYEPVITYDTVAPQNGLTLMRTSPYAPQGDSLQYVDYASATLCPDFVFKVEYKTARPTKWVIADAKYSSLSTTITARTLPALFKYLWNIRDRSSMQAVDSLHLIYAWGGQQSCERAMRVAHCPQGIYYRSADPLRNDDFWQSWWTHEGVL